MVLYLPFWFLLYFFLPKLQLDFSHPFEHLHLMSLILPSPYIILRFRTPDCTVYKN